MSQHTELIARLHGLTGTLKSGAWSTIAEAADALQAMEPSELDKTADNNKVICPNCCHQFTAIPVNVQTRLQAMERVPMTEQPIEDAPKDGTAVLLCFPGLGWVRGSWDSQIHHKKPKPYWTHDCIHYMSVAHARANQPNWWMPLPTPPESK